MWGVPNVSERTNKILLIIISICVMAMYVSVLLLPQPTKYEISFYSAIPLGVWVLLVLALVLSLIVFASRPSRRVWIYAVILCGIIVTFVTILPYIRGYYMFFTGDSLYHIGVIRDVIQSGQITDSNIYPSLHLLASAFVLVSGLSIESSAILISLSVTLVSVLAGIIVALVLPLPKRGRMLTTGLVFILLTGPLYYIFAPWGKSQLLSFYIVLWLVFTDVSTSRRRTILASLVILSTIPFHVFTSLTLLMLVFVPSFVQAAKRIMSSSTRATGAIPIVLLISGIAWMYWVLSIDRFSSILRKSITSLLFPGLGPRSSTVAESTAIISNASVNLLDIASLFVFRYGKSVLIIGLALFLVTFRMIWHRKRHPVYDRWVVFPFLLFWVLGTISVFLPFPAFSVDRLYLVGVLLAVLIIGAEISFVLNTRPRFARGVLVVSVVLLLLVVPLTIATTYNGSGNKIANPQILRSEMSSANWFFENTEVAKAYSIGPKINRLASYSSELDRSVYTVRPPPHFNWSASDEETVDPSPRYLITTPRDRQINPAFYPGYEQKWDYTPQDFEAVDNSRQVERVYSAGAVTIYRLHIDVQ